MNTSTFVGNLAGDPKLITSRTGSERAVFCIALDEFSKDDDAPRPTSTSPSSPARRTPSPATSPSPSPRASGSWSSPAPPPTRWMPRSTAKRRTITKTSFVATSVAPDLRWQSAKITKVVADRDEDAAEDRPGRSGRRVDADEDETEDPPARTTRRKAAPPADDDF